MRRSYPRDRRRGSTLIEFTFVGIPLIFVLISIFEISRGMWIYTNMAHAFKEGARYAIVNGISHKTTCEDVNGKGADICKLKVQHIASVINFYGVGLVPDDVKNVTISVANVPVASGTLTALLNNATEILPVPTPGDVIDVRGSYDFKNAISMFWPGAGPGMVFQGFPLPASAQEVTQF
jgi:Flp pilus assembly protein TadG